MSLSAWEQRALDSIKDELTGSDPKLAALLSAFTRLASDEDMPGGENIQPGLRRALRRLRRARWHATFRRVRQHLNFQRTAALLFLLTTAAVLAVTLALNAGGDRAPCLQWVAAAAVCISPAPGHSPGRASHGAATDQAAQQHTAGIQQASSKTPASGDRFERAYSPLWHGRGLTTRLPDSGYSGSPAWSSKARA